MIAPPAPASYNGQFDPVRVRPVGGATAGPGRRRDAMRKRLLTTPVFAVEHREFPRSGHPTVSRDVVVHPGAVVVLPLLGADRIVMIRNYRYTVDEALLELPAGTREPDEAPADTARRELQEETGYRAGRLEPMAVFYTSPGVLTERMHAFVATDLAEVGRHLQPGECIERNLVTVDDARRMLVDGRLRDGKTMAVLGMFLVTRDAR